MPMTAHESICIEKGQILIYRVFDVAEEIHLKKVEELVQNKDSSRFRLNRQTRRAVVIKNAPVRINLGESEFTLGPHLYKAEVTVTIWDYGVLSVLFQVPIPAGTTWRSLLDQSLYITGDTAVPELEELARSKSKEITNLIAPALQKPEEWEVYEDYTVYFFEKLSGVANPQELVEKVNMAALILGEPSEDLSAKSKDPILENIFQYATNDLSVIDWNAAVVVEPSGIKDIPDVLEFALTHLMEVRYYDDLLDTKLNDLYTAIESKRSRPLFGSRFSKISHEANSRYIEFSEFIERVDNSLKVVGDFYLAVIFRAINRRFRIHDWEQSIRHKMNLLARVSELLQGEVHNQRSLLLEVIVIILIAFEVLSAIIKSI